MKIIDKSGKRVDGKASSSDIKKKLKEEDPIIRNAVKDENIEEFSPMDPPDAYDKEKTTVKGVDVDNLDKALDHFIQEHNEMAPIIDKFDEALNRFKEMEYQLDQETNDIFNEFFVYFDSHIMPHNRKEERHLFPALHNSLIAAGEHGEDNLTSVDLMEDDHVKFIQLATLSFNFLGLAARLPDNHSRFLVLDIAYHNSRELIELLKLHVFREDNTLFPLAQKYMDPKDLAAILEKL